MNKFFNNLLTFLHHLRHLSWYVRLFIVLASFLIIESCVISALSMRGTDRGVATLLIITGIAAAWLFPLRLAFALEVMLLLVYLSIAIAIIGWNWTIISVFPVGVCTDLFICATVGFLRLALEKEEATRIREQHLAEMKDQFVRNVHHELKTPLTAIDGFLELLKASWDKISRKERELFLDHALYGCSELERIVSSILDALRVDTDVSPPQIKEFDLSATISEVLRHMSMDNHPLHIDIPQSLLAKGDTHQVAQVVLNFLTNALKYTPEDSSITVSAWQNGSFACVCVQDQGPGIPPEQASQLFQKFARLPRDVAGSVRGIGLGLYICKRFIENMGGHIWVESSGVEGEGSKFCFTVPCAAQTGKTELKHFRAQK